MDSTTRLNPYSVPILSVTRFTQLAQELIEDNLAELLLRGEISNLARPASGHWYFSLKDEHSQIRAVMFRTANRRVPFTLENGQQILCRARASVYTPRGDLQLVVEEIEPEGIGGLQIAFEQLKNRLEQEGLFAPEHKTVLPPYPQSIGIVTSATGAAVHDILNILERRTSGLHIVLRPTVVQGEEASASIVDAIEEFNTFCCVDVLIVGRGGGSLEDLQAFNSEGVARAIFNSQIPVISATGHETDYTIADFVADLRAPTPSAAAELVVKNRNEVEQHVDQLRLRLGSAVKHRLERNRSALATLMHRLRSPVQQLQLRKQELENLRQRLDAGIKYRLENCRYQLSTRSRELEALSPMQTLKRGFAVVEKQHGATLVTSAAELESNERIKIRFSDDAVWARVE
ncbi:MAG: exodeoxyribonuclease VII large subunit [Desulfuromonadaceae bacterium]|nr:exodeoxyribonuclease VII large subunit [Desulfuromonadaceae bacterium]